jgi:peptidoglycan/LPS O-acetylase OafA/YrhL
VPKLVFTAVSGLFCVEIFFVISGFILPYSLWKGGYVRRDYGKFILKRVVRLDPPYFGAIILALTAAYLTSLSPSIGAPRSPSLVRSSYCTSAI